MVWPSPFSQAPQSFWFDLLCLDSKGAKKQAWCSKQKMHFPGYEENSKEYHLYDEVNKKFVISRDVIFLETNKNDQSIERQLDRLEKYPHPKKYSENEYEIPNLEGGFLFWINLWNFHMKQQLPRMTKFLLLHLNKRFNWMM